MNIPISITRLNVPISIKFLLLILSPKYEKNNTVGAKLRIIIFRNSLHLIFNDEAKIVIIDIGITGIA